MRSDTLKVMTMVLSILLVLVSLFLNYVWYEELRQYNAVEIFLAERERSAEECAAYATQINTSMSSTASDLLRIIAAQKGDAESQYFLWYWRNRDIEISEEAREQWKTSADARATSH